MDSEAPSPRLGPFILANMEPILADWESFARRSWEGPLPSSDTLRNDAEVMLRAIVSDMGTDQTEPEKQTKSEGNAVGDVSGLNAAALGHALTRVTDGFGIDRMVAEFRALRATVSRLWWQSLPVPHIEQVEDMERFNEAMDQLVAASVKAFTARLEHSRQLFLAILGHDLRQPLFSVKMYADVLTKQGPPSDSIPVIDGISRSCEAMSKLLADLLDFTTTRLGCPMPVYPAECDIGTIARLVVEEVRVTLPQTDFKFTSEGDLYGQWDAARLRQMVSNLIANAIQHGTPGGPVVTVVRDAGEDVWLTVHNLGNPIPANAVGTLFDPMVRIADDDKPRAHGSIGLGLYISKQIALAHNGDITVTSTADEGTTFSVRLPKKALLPGG